MLGKKYNYTFRREKIIINHFEIEKIIIRK
jgi:hypothetical protein